MFRMSVMDAAMNHHSEENINGNGTRIGIIGSKGRMGQAIAGISKAGEHELAGGVDAGDDVGGAGRSQRCAGRFQRSGCAVPPICTPPSERGFPSSSAPPG